MALQRGSGNRFNPTIWPGFVDAMTGLLLVLMFVLTIFTVVQFVLRDEISGQATQLTELTAKVASLTQALGLEQVQTTELSATVAGQTSVIDRLTGARDAQALARAEAETRITGFEAQVAGLLADRAGLRDAVAGLEQQQAGLLSEQQALDLALATARTEIDAGAEAARLAAARRAALEALVTQLRTNSAAQGDQIGALEAAQLVDAAAAQVLRDRLAGADAELTAMTLALEEQRRQAEETLTLLAAARAQQDVLEISLANAVLAGAQAADDLAQTRTTNSDLDARLVAALAAQTATTTELTQAQTALAQAGADQADLSTRLAAALVAGELAAFGSAAAEAALRAALTENVLSRQEVERRLAAAVLAQQATSADRADLQSRLAAALLAQQDGAADLAATRLAQQDGVADLAAAEQAQAGLRAQLAQALAAMADAGAAQLTEAQQQAALLATATAALRDEQTLSTESQREVALLNEQVAGLRTQVATLQTLLDVSAGTDSAAQVQIEALGSQLNTALARVAAEQRRALALESAERTRLQAETLRLAAEAQDLERYRSEFFGRLRDVLDGQDGVRIAGDRFVFSSEVLFRPGSATLSLAGEAEIAKVGAILQRVSGEIPDGIDWVIRVDGHTDDVPLLGGGVFANNWELSQARALSVVMYMIAAQGIAPERLAANGFGEFQPVATGDTEAARAQNRRIEIKLTER